MMKTGMKINTKLSALCIAAALMSVAQAAAAAAPVVTAPAEATQPGVASPATAAPAQVPAPAVSASVTTPAPAQAPSVPATSAPAHSRRFRQSRYTSSSVCASTAPCFSNASGCSVRTVDCQAVEAAAAVHFGASSSRGCQREANAAG